MNIARVAAFHIGEELIDELAAVATNDPGKSWKCVTLFEAGLQRDHNWKLKGKANKIIKNEDGVFAIRIIPLLTLWTRIFLERT